MNAAYSAAAPANAPNARISRLIQTCAARARRETRTAAAPGERCSPRAPAARRAARPRVVARAAPAAGRSAPAQQELDDERAHRQLRQHQHEHQRQVRVRRPHLVKVGRQHVARQRPLASCTPSSARVMPGRRRARQEALACASSSDCARVDDADRDRLVRTRLHAGGRLARRQPIAAHVALAHDAALLAELRHLVRAGEHAVLAADALVVQVPDDAGRPDPSRRR